MLAFLTFTGRIAHAQLPAVKVWPLLPSSFSIDLSGMITFAETIFNSLAGALTPVWGIILGVGLVLLVGSVIAAAIKFKK